MIRLPFPAHVHSPPVAYSQAAPAMQGVWTAGPTNLPYAPYVPSVRTAVQRPVETRLLQQGIGQFVHRALPAAASSAPRGQQLAPLVSAVGSTVSAGVGLAPATNAINSVTCAGKASTLTLVSHTSGHNPSDSTINAIHVAAVVKSHSPGPAFSSRDDLLLAGVLPPEAWYAVLRPAWGSTVFATVPC